MGLAEVATAEMDLPTVAGVEVPADPDLLELDHQARWVQEDYDHSDHYFLSMYP